MALTATTGSLCCRYAVAQSSSRQQVAKMASCVDEELKVRKVQLLLRQEEQDPHMAVVECVLATRLEEIEKKLEDEGLTMGPKASRIMYLQEGQAVTLGFRGNIGLGPNTDSSLLRFIFHSYMRGRKMFRLEVDDMYGQHAFPQFHGACQIFEERKVQVVNEDSKEDVQLVQALLCELKVTLPKV